MSTRIWITIVVILAIIIFALAWLLFTTPVEAPTVTKTQMATTSARTGSNSATPTTSSSKAVVTTPATNAVVAHSFTVSGNAPNTWYFEAVFPIQVRDSDDDLVATAQARAQSDWTKPGPVPFTAKVTVKASYSGPATLIILKDNPSGNPENSDEITVPIVVQ